MPPKRVHWQAGWFMGLVLAALSAQAVELDSLPEVVADVAGAEAVKRELRQFFFGSVGVTAINTGGFLGSDERVTFPFPLMYFNSNDQLYWSIASVGGWLWHSADRKFKLGLLAKSRGAVEAEDTGYAGIEDRERSVDAGINLFWDTRLVTLGASWLYDIGGVSDGQSASLRVSKRFALSDRWNSTPSLVVDWMDAKLVDYYYGIDPAETGGGAPVYAGRSSTNLRAAWSLGYRLSKDWSLTAGLSYTRFGAGLRDSPLTQQDRNTLVFVGASWSFLTVHQ